MPPEFLVDGTFTLEGDRWSYGILLWEICSLGGSPMMGVPVENLLDYLQSGRRPVKPEGCTPTAYRIMQLCWHEDRYNRPTPDQLMADFDYMLRSQTNKSKRFFTEDFKERHNNGLNDKLYELPV
ncbi:fibroblast growth factor receptor 2-like [Ptychodera flava]